VIRSLGSLERTYSDRLAVARRGAATALSTDGSRGIASGRRSVPAAGTWSLCSAPLRYHCWAVGGTGCLSSSLPGVASWPGGIR
jgi:hypothetical protein